MTNSSLRKDRLPLHPLPPLAGQALRLTTVFDKAEPGRKGVEELKEAGGLRPPASLKTSPLPRLDDLALTPQLAGGGVRGGGWNAMALFQQPARVSLLLPRSASRWILLCLRQGNLAPSVSPWLVAASYSLSCCLMGSSAEEAAASAVSQVALLIAASTDR